MEQLNLEKATLANRDYRRVWSTGTSLQVVLMCLLPGESVPWETHSDIDQFIRVEKGELTIQLINNGLIKEIQLRDGEAYIIPAGTQHQLINGGSRAHAKFYTLYSKIEHPPGHIEHRQSMKKV